MSAPQLSVVIPSYKEEGRLRQTLASLADQTLPAANAEIIVVDDATPQFDPAGLEELAHPFALTLIRHPTNLGRSRSRNDGIIAARGEVIVFLDSDMTVESDFLLAHAALHQGQQRKVGIGQVRFAPEIPSIPFTRYVESRGVHRLKPNQPVGFKCFATGNASVHRRQLDRTGLFDNSFTAYGGEDLELGYRLHLKDSSFHYLPNALSWHHHLRPLEQIYALMHTYGRHSLPLLLEKHPELAGLLRVDFLGGSTFSLRRLLFSSALCRPLYYPLQFLTGLGFSMPDLVFDYLLWYNRTKGFIKASRDRPNRS